MTDIEFERLRTQIRQLPSTIPGDGRAFIEQLKKALEAILKEIQADSNRNGGGSSAT